MPGRVVSALGVSFLRLGSTSILPAATSFLSANLLWFPAPVHVRRIHRGRNWVIEMGDVREDSGCASVTEWGSPASRSGWNPGVVGVEAGVDGVVVGVDAGVGAGVGVSGTIVETGVGAGGAVVGSDVVSGTRVLAGNAVTAALGLCVAVEMDPGVSVASGTEVIRMGTGVTASRGSGPSPPPLLGPGSVPRRPAGPRESPRLSTGATSSSVRSLPSLFQNSEFLMVECTRRVP